jgi:hypothetical protein
VSTTQVDIEEIESTRSEKFLAVVLMAFLLIGTIWFYAKVPAWTDARSSYEQTPAQVQLERQHQDALARNQQIHERLDRAQVEVDLAKDQFDIVVAKGRDSAAAEQAYARAQSEFRSAQSASATSDTQVRELEKKSAAADRANRGGPSDAKLWLLAGIRLSFVVGWLLGSLWLLSELRRRQSRFLPLGFAAVGAGVVTAVVFGVDYITDYIDPMDLGPIVLAAIGAFATVAAFVGLQRYLAQRIPGRRVRRGECPFCGFPVREDALRAGRDHCEGCGRDVVASCASCDSPRRVGTPHCAACGAA